MHLFLKNIYHDITMVLVVLFTKEITVFLERIFQFKVLQDKYSTLEIFSFIKDFKVTEAENKYINTTTYSDFINDLAEKFHLPLTNYFLTETKKFYFKS